MTDAPAPAREGSVLQRSKSAKLCMGLIKDSRLKAEKKSAGKKSFCHCSGKNHPTIMQKFRWGMQQEIHSFCG